MQKNSFRLEKLNTLISAFKDKVFQTGLKLPKYVKIVEVGPRDGLQNEKTIVPAQEKVEFINRLSHCGFQAIEVTSFVSPKWVPQMGDNAEVFGKIIKDKNKNYPCLVPNLKGLESALKVGVKEIAVFGAASETFSQKNINCSIAESLEKFREVIDQAKQHNLLIRGYVSCVMGCPYEGDVSPQKVNEVASALYQMGCYEISLGDTIGVGTPEKTQALLDQLTSVPRDKLAAHFHDTYDRAIENILIALGQGISVVDSSIAGLGGCPYANTKAGNVCTENVLYTLQELGIQTGIDFNETVKVGKWISQKLNRDSLSIIE